MTVTVEQATWALEGYEQHVKRQLRCTHWHASEDPDLIACLKMRQQWIDSYRVYLKEVLRKAEEKQHG